MKEIILAGNIQPLGNRSLRPSIGITALIAALVACACDKSEQAPPPPPATVDVAEVVQKDVPIHQEWVGSLDGMVNAQILAQVSGYLIKQYYQEGQAVKKGQLLYEIDPKIFQATLDGARGNLARQEAVLKTARLDLERVERLLPERAVSVRDRDNAVGREASAQAEVQAAKAAVDSAQLQLGFTKIISPIDGIAGLSKAQLGNLVGPGSANAELTTISQLDPIKAYIPLSEQEYLQFARNKQSAGQQQDGQSLELILADGSAYPHPGKFFFADREVNIKTGTIQVAILFPNPGSLLRPGQYAKVRAVVKHKPGALLVPQRAVGEMQGRRLVAVVKPDNSVELRPVKAAETIGTQWIIDEGLRPGERVIAEGIQKVRPGATIDPKPYAEESPATGGR
ncbi:efflux RND transporter periplasmic adaptor subunit [Methylomonas sp. LL1]|uniref:efflux RND transporter periplasmic adaptor subunit n=1 Tax=Methylomonas sp. LL1 TaxID=2785785 RepID=UPI0018C3551C|nr:efflux RND transporter periplasmic adaptor subunit [Methylomonas sp. LL1]QPK63578.1 efflux RND transporter periplasmic adaptor subunit [Methylomonas sp. LL1]